MFDSLVWYDCDMFELVATKNNLSMQSTDFLGNS